MPDCCVERKSGKFMEIRELMTRIVVDKAKRFQGPRGGRPSKCSSCSLYTYWNYKYYHMHQRKARESKKVERNPRLRIFANSSLRIRRYLSDVIYLPYALQVFGTDASLLEN